MPADRRRLQAAGRDQPPAAAVAGGAGARRGRFLVGQSCARSGDRGAAARHSGGDRDAGRRAAGEDRGHARRGRGDHLLRPAQREPRGDRRADLRRDGRDRGAELRRSGDRRRAGHRRARNPRADGRSASAAHRHSVRRRRAWRRASRWPVPDAEIVIVEPEGWDDMAARSSWARSCRWRPMRPHTFATRCRRRACRRSPSASSASARATGAVRQRRGSGGRDALRLGAARTGGRAGRRGRRWRRCSRARLAATWRIRWWCCRAGMSIRRCTRGSSRRRLGRAACSIFAGLEVDRARALDGLASAPRARRRGSSVRRRGSGARPRRPIRRRRSAFRASSRCTAGSFPRSARTPLRGAPAARSFGMAPMWTDLG